jgi:rSAM/selenodomain-associated transferase 1
MRYPNAHLLVFAKAPVAGEVKSRLAATIGQEQAAQIYSCMLQRTVMLVARADLAPASLVVTPDTAHPLFPIMEERYGLELLQQQGGDLGERMHNALEGALGKAEYALLIGTDCPVLDEGYLEDALARLDGGADVVIGPAEDGGYTLIGMRCSEPLLFSDISWGGPEVMAATRERCSEAGLTLQELEQRYDIDTYDDLLRFVQEVPGGLEV